MKENLVRDLTHYLDAVHGHKLGVGHCNDMLKHRVESWDISLDMKRLLQWSWFNKQPYEGRHILYSVEEVVNQQDQDRFLAEHLICIGYCANGDMIAVDDTSERRAVLFATHELVWGEDKPIRDCCVLIHKSLAEFLLRLAEAKFIPSDFYSGQDYRGLIDEMT